jgi:hypothetical protein
MRGEIQTAMAVLDERKTAVFDDPIGTEVGEHQQRLMTLGFDLDVVELAEMSGLVSQAMLVSLGLGKCTPPTAFQGAWVDGLLTGLLIAKARETEARRQRRREGVDR